MGKIKNKANIRDVAKAAGVSVASVVMREQEQT